MGICAYKYEFDDPSENLPNVLMTTALMTTKVCGNNFPTL